MLFSKYSARAAALLLVAGHARGQGIPIATGSDAGADGYLMQRLGMDLFDEMQRVHHFRQVLARHAKQWTTTQTNTDENRIKLLLQLGDWDVRTDFHATPKFHA